MGELQYAAICRGYTVLVSYQDEKSVENAERYLTDFLCTLTTEADAKTSFSGGSFKFHLQIKDGVVFACGAIPSAGVRLPFLFLAELSRKFNATTFPSRVYNADEHEFDREFRHVLKETLEAFNKKNVVDPIETLQNEARAVTGIMQDNIDKVLVREGNINQLLGRTEELANHSVQFSETSARVRRKMWFKNVKYWIIIGIVVSIIVTLIVVAIVKKS